MNSRPSAALEQRGDAVRIRVRVQPKASRNAVHIEPDGRVRIALTAPPVGGAANDMLIRFVAKKVGVSRRAITLVSGEKSRDKVVEVTGVSVADVWRSLCT